LPGISTRRARRPPPPACRRRRRRAHAGLGVDVTDEGSVAQATAASLVQARAIDILVCSAGITGPNATVIDYDPAAWRRVFEVNVHGVFLCNRAVVRATPAAGYGRVINIASVAGKDGNPNASAYSASKAAVIAAHQEPGQGDRREIRRVRRQLRSTPAAVRTAIFDQITPQHIDFMLSKIPHGPLRAGRGGWRR
jgi:3-oxoacyl-[acyl-carrier protein] reductase